MTTPFHVHRLMEEHPLRRRTPHEEDADRTSMIAHKQPLEELFPGAILSIEEAEEWAAHWKIPFEFGPQCGNITARHWSAVRALGLNLREQREGVEGITYTVDLPKTYHRWRNWPLWQIALLAAFGAGITGSATVVALRLVRLFG